MNAQEFEELAKNNHTMALIKLHEMITGVADIVGAIVPEPEPAPAA